MRKYTNASLIDMDSCLDDILADNPQLIFPDEFLSGMIGSKNGINYIIAAFHVYDLVKEFIRTNRPVFDDDDDTWIEEDNGELRCTTCSNETLLRDMKCIYVCGYGKLDISNVYTKPLLTGHILSFQDWESLLDTDDPQEMDVYTALGIVAETVAVQRDDSWDVTCMQFSEYQILQLGANRTTLDYKGYSKGACWNNKTVSRNIPYHILYAWTEDCSQDLDDVFLKFTGDRDYTPEGYVYAYKKDCILWCLDLDIDFYPLRSGDFIPAVNIYNVRVRRGEEIYEERLR